MITCGELTAEGFLTGVGPVVLAVVTYDELTAEGFLTGVISVVVTYIDSTAEGFFIDTVNSPFDVFTVFELEFSPKKSTLRCLVPVTSSGHTLSLCAVCLFNLAPDSLANLFCKTIR